ncbi:MAG: fertility inhibition FinO-like protein [Leptolyngbya sp.]|nr:MAG: fertility inhibition FinO-like protein [Leptolyngbya sp.]
MVEPISGRLEITIKTSEFPKAETVENGHKHFTVDCDGRQFSVTVKPKVFKKLEEAQANFPSWIAAISGKLGEATETGFILEQAAIQVFERKPKEEVKS